MLYLSQMLNEPVQDASGVKIGTVSDFAISTGEMFPRITSLAFMGPRNTPFMISWRKYVDNADDDHIKLNVNSKDIRFSYQQPDEILVARDLMDRQIVDTQGKKVVRVNDLKFSPLGAQLRLVGAEVGIRGLLRGLHPALEKAVCKLASAVKHPIGEQIIAWNYMDLLDRDLSEVKLSVTHKRLDELHPADVADILEQLDPAQRALVFQHLDEDRAIDAVSEMEDDAQTEFLDDLDDATAAKVIGDMDPDDAVEIVRGLSYEKAETLLRLMGVEDAAEIRSLLGYRDETAGGMMTTQFVAANQNSTVQEAVELLRGLDDDFPTVHNLYVTDSAGRLAGVVSLRTLVLSKDDTKLKDIMYTDVISVSPDMDEDDVVSDLFKYELPAMPVVDEAGKLLGIVTTDDAWDVIEEDVNPDRSGMGRIRAWGWVTIGAACLALYTFALISVLRVTGLPF